MSSICPKQPPSGEEDRDRDLGQLVGIFLLAI